MALSVLHISTTDNLGGSGRAAYRIHRELQRQGVTSQMAVGVAITADPTVHRISSGPWRWLDAGARRIFDQGLGWQYWCYPSSFALAARRIWRQADIIQLYNTHGGYFSHTALPLLSHTKPIVWRLSDLWPMTGHCPFDITCGQPQGQQPGRCRQYREYPALPRDTSARLWQMKRWCYRHSRLTIVAPSRWIENQARQSELLGQFPIYYIATGVDTTVFQPQPKRLARQQLGLPVESPIILFSAHSLKETRKGGALLAAALKQLAGQARQPVTIVTVGRGDGEWTVPAPFRHHAAGAVADEQRLAQWYAAADLLVLPTQADNLPNGLLESLACGTPAVSCAVGGVPEVIIHGQTGYLARAGDSADLAHGMYQLLSDAPLRERCGAAGRRLITQQYDLRQQTQKLITLYQQLVL